MAATLFFLRWRQEATVPAACALFPVSSHVSAFFRNMYFYILIEIFIQTNLMFFHFTARFKRDKIQVGTKVCNF